jgi:uncharacterized membrane protein YesL
MDMSQLLLVTANFFVLIICLIGVQTCYFRQRWRWFWLMLVCVILSGACISIILYQWFVPVPATELPLFNRSPTTPL